MKRKASATPLSSSQMVRRRKKDNASKQNRILLARRTLNSQDVKSHRIIINAVTPSSAGPLFYSLTDIAFLTPGTGMVNQYIGNKIKPLSLTVRFSVVMADSSNVVRMGIFQCEGPFTTATTNYFPTNTNPLSCIENYPTNPFNTLSDNLISGCVPGGHNAITTRRVYIKGSKMLPLTFNQAGAITAGHIGMVILCDSAAPAHPTVSIYSEMRFTDS